MVEENEIYDIRYKNIKFILIYCFLKIREFYLDAFLVILTNKITTGKQKKERLLL